MVNLSQFSVQEELERERTRTGSRRPALRIRLRDGGGENDRPAAAAGPEPSVVICKVCKQEGHFAGFRGAVYWDCASKPCFLCFARGHSTMFCPHRARLSTLDPTRGRWEPSDYLRGKKSEAWNACTELARRILRRECMGGHIDVDKLPSPPCAEGATLEPDIEVAKGGSSQERWQLSQVIPRMSLGRIGSMTLLCPSSGGLSIAVGDRAGEIMLWNSSQESDENPPPPQLLARPHDSAMVNKIIAPGDGFTCYSVGTDGALAASNEAASMILFKASRGARGLHSLAYMKDEGLFAAGDANGNIYLVDQRQAAPAAVLKKSHAPGRVNSLDTHPHGRVFASSGFDRTVRFWDVRCTGMLAPKACEGGSSQIGSIAHCRSVTCVRFSCTGRKFMSLCADNRIRLWKGLPWGGFGEPFSKIVHSHNFNRYLTPPCAAWDPKDPMERRIVCGRYISENIEGKRLHPVDILDSTTGNLLGELVDESVPLISSLVAVHPVHDCIVSACSRTVCIWRFAKEQKVVEAEESVPMRSIARGDFPTISGGEEVYRGGEGGGRENTSGAAVSPMSASFKTKSKRKRGRSVPLSPSSAVRASSQSLKLASSPETSRQFATEARTSPYFDKSGNGAASTPLDDDTVRVNLFLRKRRYRGERSSEKPAFCGSDSD